MYRKKNLDMTLYRGLSTDTKPDADFGSVFHEMDTGDVYRTDGDEWHQCGSLSGTDPSIYMSRWVRGNTKKAWELLALAGGHGEQAVYRTVTGNPISVSDALAAKIKSLIVSHTTTQDGTPTPSSPVDIECNNGALRMVDDELPSGYRRITGIKFDGDFWYNTGEALTGDDDVTMTLANTATSGQNVFGSYNGTSAGKKNFSLYIYGGGSTNNCYLRYGEQLLRPRFGSNERTITFGKSGTSGFTTDVTATPDEFVTEAPAYIGMLPNSTSPEYTGSIIGNILVSDRLKYVPCERTSDGKVGYYETYNDVFLEPVGTGTPVKGSYDTSHLTVLTVVGTPEVLTISDGTSAQTASVENLFGVGNYKDEQDIISGVVTRRVGVCIYDGTQTIGDVYLSTTGGKDVGAIIVYPLAEETTEHVTAQPMHTYSGNTIVQADSGTDITMTYKATE